MSDKKIFPQTDTVFIKDSFSNLLSGVIYLTWLRKKYRGKYYLQCVIRRINYSTPVEVMTALRDQYLFFSDIYNNLLFSKVDPKMMLISNGCERHAFELDTDQRSEEERLGIKL